MSILDLKPPRSAADRPAQVAPIRSTSAQDVAAAEQPPWYRRRKTLWAAAALAALMVGAVWLSYDWSQSGNVISMSRLETTTVARGQFVQDVAARGTVIAAISPTLFATAAGTVHYVVHAGDHVTQGQELAVLDSPLLRNEYQRELATLKSMNAALSEERVRLREQLLTSEQEANLDAVRMNAELRDLQRAQSAWKVHVISEERYEGAYDTYTIARLNFEHARNNAHLAQRQILLDLRTRTLARDAQSLRVAELRSRMDALQVRSPVTGLVADLAQPDETYVAENVPLVTVVDLSALAIEFQVAESLAGGITPGVPAEITLGGETVKGVVTDIAPAVRNGWVTGRLRFEGAPPSGLRQNEQASVRIILGQHDNVLHMDRGAYISPQTRFVYVVRADQAVRVPVTFGAASISEIEVLQGLTAGETVVISNPDKLHDAPEVKLSR
jgi:HlyD family secretion protein